MGMFNANRTAAVTISALLAGCATTAPMQKDATILSSPDRIGGKTTQGEDTDFANLGASLDLEGALRQAQAQRKMGDLVAATRTLSQLVLVAPDDSRVLGEYGKTLVAQGRSDDALAFLERAAELQASDWSLFSAQGVAYDQKGQYNQAQAAYARALALKPGEPTVLSNNALSHIVSGDLDEAERLLQEAAQAGGDNPRIASNLALVQSLRASRGNATPAPAKLAVQPPAPPPPPAPVAAPPEEVAPVAATDIEEAPAEEAPLLNAPPAPENAVVVQTPDVETMDLRASDSGPSVQTQKVPVESQASPAVRKQTVPAKPATVAKAAAPAGKKPAAEQASLLRPSLGSTLQANSER